MSLRGAKRSLRKQGSNPILANLQLVSELGLAIVLPIIIAVLIGVYLDKKFARAGIFTFIFLIFGLGGGFLGAYRLIKKALKNTNDHG